MIFQDLLDARVVIKSYVSETPLIQLAHVNEILGCQIYFKLENMQIGNAFKIRGPSNKLQSVKANRKVAAFFTANPFSQGLPLKLELPKVPARYSFYQELNWIQKIARVYPNQISGRVVFNRNEQKFGRIPDNNQ